MVIGVWKFGLNEICLLVVCVVCVSLIRCVVSGLCMMLSELMCMILVVLNVLVGKLVGLNVRLVLFLLMKK